MPQIFFKKVMVLREPGTFEVSNFHYLASAYGGQYPDILFLPTAFAKDRSFPK